MVLNIFDALNNVISQTEYNISHVIQVQVQSYSTNHRNHKEMVMNVLRWLTQKRRSLMIANK